MAVVRVDGLEPDLKILGTHQRYIFGEIAANPLNRKSIDNLFVPTALAAAETLLDFRNSNSFSGFRLRHETALGDTIGKLKFQSFTGGSTSGTDLLVFHNDGSVVLPGMTDPKYILQTANANLPNAQALSALSTGLLKNTTTTGVLSIAVPGVDYATKANVDAVADGKFIIQTADADLPNAQALGALSTGLLKNTTTTGLLSIAVAGTDYATLAHRLDQFAVPNTSLNLNSQKIINLLNPTNPQDAATMAYVDSAVDNNFGPQVALPFLELDWNWANPGAQATYKNYHKLNDAFTTKTMESRIIADDASSPNRRGWIETWYIGPSIPGTNDYGLYTFGFAPSSSAAPLAGLVYTVTINSSVGSSLAMAIPISMNNWRITQVGTPLNLTDAANRQYVLDQVILGVNAGVVTLTGSVTGSGLVNGSFATAFSNSQTISGTTETFNYSNALTTSILELVNTNASALTRFKAGSTTDYLETGYDGANDYSYLNIVGSSNDRYAFRFGGTGVAAVTSTGLWGFGTVSPTLAKLHVVGGVTNVGSEETGIRVVSSSNTAKIELQCTNGSGRLWEITASNNGFLNLVDRTGVAARLVINTSGQIGIGTTTPHAALQFANVVTNRQLVLYEAANNDFQFHGLGSVAGGLGYNINTTTDSHIFYAGVNSSSRNEVGRLSGVGDLTIADTYFGKRPTGVAYMQGNATVTTVTAGNWTKVAGTTTSDSLNKCTMPANNRIQYTGTPTVRAYVVASVTASHNVGAGSILGFSIFKNGVQVVPSASYVQTALNIVGNVFVKTIVSLATNDYVEVYGTSSANADITVSNLTFDLTTT